MSDTITAPAAPAKARTVEMIADCDIHPINNSPKDLFPFLSARWQDYLNEFGAVFHQYYTTHPILAKAHAKGLRRDAYPPEGGYPGSSLAFMREQHLDPNNVAFGTLIPLPGEQGVRNTEFSAAYCAAINDWQFHEWTLPEKRLKGSLVVPIEDPEAAVKEIERWEDVGEFVQIAFPSRSGAPYGQKRYWPIYEAACRTGRPICVHPNYADSDVPLTSGGWPSYYIEEMMSYAQAYQGHLASLISNGVFDAFPSLRVVLVEGGIGWLPSFLWRLDKLMPRFKTELPHLKRLPSEYFRDHVWVTSQPIEEPRNPQHLRDTIEWIGWDKVMFSSDYPHWDTDDAQLVVPFKATPEQRRGFLLENALRFYGANV
ncbi:amidohydrolase family protein [Sinorhizobium meliloti]|uniref:amidohydrolase family protein n=1 Tax=Rhizobium meliloti TaxID=382 RepID=UPI00051BE673|nr:amidohydrolase family protein [Sinorhizobium meliloti]